MGTTIRRLIEIFDKAKNTEKTCNNCDGYEECKKFFSNPTEEPCFIWREKEAQQMSNAVSRAMEKEKLFRSTIEMLKEQLASVSDDLTAARDELEAEKAGREQAEAQCVAMSQELEWARKEMGCSKGCAVCNYCSFLRLCNMDNTAGADLLAKLQRYREALEEIAEIQMVQREPPFIVKNPMQIAKAALEAKP